jgi:multicomponent Na+:H+ antiporter subunit F
MTASGAFTDVINVVFVMLVVAYLLSFIRLVRGPSLPDRVVALDLIAALSVAMIIVYTIASDQRIFIDAAIVLALITFLGTVAFAQYVERRARSG